ncbi:MAG: PA0069 family radical SAM protein [Gemmatimonadetes bacterium]|nr:PA0069 family radical SAM protein [Gemmatimonadota bacterium]
MIRLPIRGRGVPDDPPNRFERRYRILDPGEAPEARLSEFIPDHSLSIVARNESPDVGFDASVNPYRGCEHGCVYCYARPTHEFLGFSSSLDFERKILFKQRAPELLRAAFSKPGWKPQVLGMSGVTDPYQPAERRLRLTRGVLEVLRDFRNPVSIVTKNHLVTRDADLLSELADYECAMVTLSITTLDRSLQSRMEPRTSVPSQRLKTIEALSKAGIPTAVNLAPVIPGLNDEEIPAILAAARDAGAEHAAYLLLRLPYGVADHFSQWLTDHYPDRRERVLGRIREVRGGDLNESGFFRRSRGEGPYAEHIARLFKVAKAKAGFEDRPPPLSTSAFRRGGGLQGELFG